MRFILNEHNITPKDYPKGLPIRVMTLNEYRYNINSVADFGNRIYVITKGTELNEGQWKKKICRFFVKQN
jgi:hypothetical protein